MTGDITLRPRIVTELIGARVEAWIPKLGPLHDEVLPKIGRVVTAAVCDGTIVVQIEDDAGWIYTTSTTYAYPLRRIGERSTRP